ncbi:hypothetical protein CU305_05940 [Prochlorococcus marinus str. MU1416]|nr:hypothetical protein [Prochlorococcus marinus str. MU1416]
MFFLKTGLWGLSSFKMIDHLTYGFNYVKTNPYNKRIKLIFYIAQLKKLWKTPVPSFRKNKSA